MILINLEPADCTYFDFVCRDALSIKQIGLDFVSRQSVVNCVSLFGVTILPSRISVIPTSLTHSPSVTVGVSGVDCRTLCESRLVVIVTENGLVFQFHTGLIQTEGQKNTLVSINKVALHLMHGCAVQ